MYKTPREAKREAQIQILVILSAVIVLMFIGAIVFSIFEDWTFLEALHYATISLTGRGFSSVVPTHWFSIVFSIIYLIVGVSLLIAGISATINFYSTHYQQQVSRSADHIWGKVKESKLIKPESKKKEKWIVLKK